MQLRIVETLHNIETRAQGHGRDSSQTTSAPVFGRQTVSCSKHTNQCHVRPNIWNYGLHVCLNQEKILAGAHHIASVSPVQVLSGLVLEQRSLLRGRKTTSTRCEVDEAARLFNLCSSAHFGREVLRQVPGRASLGEGSQSSWRRRIGAST